MGGSTFKRNPSRIGLLMITGILLLTLFAGRWIQTEYERQKSSLQRDLFGQFMDARSRLTDTLIARNILLPFLEDSTGIRIEMITDSDSEKETENISIPDTVHTHMHHFQERDSLFKLYVRADSSQFLYKSFRVFIGKMDGPAGETQFMEKYFEPADTALLKQYFSDNLAKNHLPLKTAWERVHVHDTFPPPPFFYEAHLPDFPFGVKVYDYDPYLFKKIAPECIFAIILLAIILAAFIFSFRTLRTQNRLAAMKDDFISNISHELRTPVATAQVALEAVQEMDPSQHAARIREYLGIAYKEMERLDALVEKVMDSLSPGTAGTGGEPVKVDIAATAEAVVRTMQVRNAPHILHVECIMENSPEWVFADPTHLQGIFFNLLDNSIKYAGVHAAIRIHIFRNGDQVELTFSDDGPGIPEIYKSNIFEKFFRVPSGNIHTVKGYGLGLYYIAQCMHAWGGSVHVKNLSQGCMFTLTFKSAA